MSGPVIGFCGMTHLGVVSAAAAADRGFSVVACDRDCGLVSALARGDLPVVEPDLAPLLARERGRIAFTSDIAELGRCDVVYLAADVATDERGQSDLAPIRAMAEGVIGALAGDAALVVLSQVPPGFTRALPLAAERLYYQVETLVFGRAVERATRPERFIVGCADPHHPLPPALAAFLAAFSCPLLPMRYESAELAKISINFCLLASLSTANLLAEVSEAIGADWAEIVPALKLDRRIGPHAYLNAGLGVAGGNLERDLHTVLAIAQTKRIDTQMLRAWVAHSAHRKDWTFDVLNAALLATKPDARITVLGLAYKENTHSTRNSPALALLDRLAGRCVVVHDPVVAASVVPWAANAPDPMAAVRGADALIIATPWPQYRDLAPAELADAMAGRLILDPYRVLDGSICAAAGFTYHTLGMAPLAPAA